MMLSELYQVGLVMKDGPDWPVPMYEKRKVRWEIWLDAAGRLRPSGIQSFAPKNKESPVIEAPDITRANGIIPYLLVDKPEYVLGLGKKGVAQHKAYMDLLQLCADETGNQAVRTVHRFLSTSCDNLLADLTALGLGEQENENQVQSNEWINFKVAETYPIDQPDVQAWWAKYARDETDTEEMCCISATHGKITRKFPVAVKLNGKNCKLASVDSPACKSYGFDKSDHAPMSHDAALIAGTALKVLVEDDRFHRRYGDTYYAFWTRDHVMRTGLLAVLGNGQEDTAKVSEIRSLFDAIFKGRQHYPREDRFYMFVATNTETRVVVRASLEGSLGEAVDNVRDWFESMELNGPGPELIVVQALHSAVHVSNKRQNRNIGLSLVKRALFGEPLGKSIYASVFPRIISRIHNSRADPRWRCPSKEQVTIIKLYLSQFKPEVKDLVALREDFPDIAYHYGRLMAAYEAIQLDASPNVQSTVTERFFSSMMVNPKRTIAKLDVLSRAHLRKVARDHGKGWEIQHSKRLQAINHVISALGVAECCTFSLDQRGLFVLGYWHEKFKTYNPETEAKGDNR
ncbi:MAG: type I-C CRISPR-associated protein Cas8c/Csd1 [Armatimonadetes bacterium]|nr:type I-C CRISPR-associated protein Cas8c/Csd1 [Armatimonadota bacterium]